MHGKTLCAMGMLLLVLYVPVGSGTERGLAILRTVHAAKRSIWQY